MKKITLNVLLCLTVFLLGSNVQAQDLLKDDIDFLDPEDDAGNKWFETEQDKTAFLNAILEATGSSEATALASIKEDVFIASVRKDDDVVYDGKSYHTLIIDKSASPQTVSLDISTTNTADHNHYTIHFFIGENMSSAEFLIDHEIPTDGSWGEDFTNDTYELDFIEVNADQSTWLELAPSLTSTLNEITLTGN